MYTVDLYLRVRLACHVDGLSQREAASRFGIARETVRKMLLGLIKAHALIHQKTRRLNEAGQIIAELSDYTAVHNLVAEVLSQGIKDTVSALNLKAGSAIGRNRRWRIKRTTRRWPSIKAPFRGVSIELVN